MLIDYKYKEIIVETLIKNKLKIVTSRHPWCLKLFIIYRGKCPIYLSFIENGYIIFFLADSENQGNKARKVNSCCVFSAYILKPALSRLCL